MLGDHSLFLWNLVDNLPCPWRALISLYLEAQFVGFKFEAAVGASRECGSGWAWLGIPGRCTALAPALAAVASTCRRGSNRQHSSRWGQWAVPASTLWHQLYWEFSWYLGYSGSLAPIAAWLELWPPLLDRQGPLGTPLSDNTFDCIKNQDQQNHCRRQMRYVWK